MEITLNSLTAPQTRFLATLLTEPTIEAAAAKAGVPSRTAHRWLTTREFRKAYSAARRECVTQATGQLQQATLEAVEALRRNLSCGQPGVEVRSALAILEQAFRATELQDLGERLEALEAQVADVSAPERAPVLRVEKGGGVP